MSGLDSIFNSATWPVRGALTPPPPKPKVVAVVLPGPTANETWKHAAACDEVVVANAAVRLARRPCWWFVADKRHFATNAELAPPGTRLVSDFRSLARVLCEADELVERHIGFANVYRSDLLLGAATFIISGWWASVGSLALAYRLGADVIQLYGLDLRGDTDCTGSQSERKTRERWEAEHSIVRTAFQQLDRRGVRVREALKKVDDETEACLASTFAERGFGVDHARAAIVDGARLDVP